MGWNTSVNWSDPTLSAIGDVMVDIASALAERYACRGLSMTTPSSDTIPLYSPLAVANLIDADITYLAGLSNAFVDSSQATGGEFVGLTSIPLINSEATLLASIGSPPRVLSSVVGITKEWVNQVYQLINALIWTRSTVSKLLNPSYDLVTQKTSSGATYALAFASWPAGWSDTAYLTQGPFVTSRNSTSVVLTRSYPRSLVYFTIASGLTHDADLYFYTIKPFGSSSIFEPHDTSFQVNKYNRFGTHSGVTTTTSGPVNFKELLGSAVPVEPLTAGPNYGFTADARTVGPVHYAVVKFDVTGGFEFR